MQLYVLIHHIIFWLYLYFLNILYCFKYSCADIFHRRSFCTFNKSYHEMRNEISIIENRYHANSLRELANCSETPFKIPNRSQNTPDSKVQGTNMGPTRACRPQMGPMLAQWNLAIRDIQTLHGIVCNWPLMMEDVLGAIQCGGTKVYQYCRWVLCNIYVWIWYHRK